MSDNHLQQRIIHEATRLFARQGYGSTSMRAVAEAAGVTKPTLYYWFGNKEELFLQVVSCNLNGITTILDGVLSAEGTVRSRLRRFIDEYTQGALQNPDAVRLLLTAQHKPDRGQPQVDLMWLHLEKVELLAQLLVEGVERGEVRADIDPKAAVMAFIGMVDLHTMAAFHHVALPENHPDLLLDIFFNGVGPS